ncbi:hypothetical protein QBC44DRAFT_321515 [Cladorrhinum sp. PSN332]|nr:hypothetical protein QBC44DRAFT_321515 [Cladorrhinum sp. PSN332]
MMMMMMMMMMEKKMVDEEGEEVPGHDEPLRKSSWYDLSTAKRGNGKERGLPRHGRNLLSKLELVASGLLMIAVQTAAVFWVVRHHVCGGGGPGANGHGPVPLGGINSVRFDFIFFPFVVVVGGGVVIVTMEQRRVVFSKAPRPPQET